MEFDNASFERKLGTTLASLGQLDKALKFTGATKGLSDVSAAAEKVSFHTISQGIENVSKSFLALSTIALTTLSNITSTAIRSGLQFVKSFTIAPILDGFREFETNANSIQTILANTASKGTTLDQVSDALNRLNAYSDQTIYNFGQMARNIGTFTAAGVDLETSVSSIKGIANLAAMSGSNAEQASNAMYQLSQAIATGSLKLMDWNSVVNAGMGGEAFKSALFETGKAMGNVLNVPVDQTFKQWEDSGNSFRESLQDGWITAEILTTTLSAFTGDMTEEMLLAKGFNEQQATAILKTAAIAKAAATEVKTFTQLLGTVKEAVGTGFADSFRIVIGNFTEAKALFTNLNNVISGFVQKTADARNEILQGWKDFGSRTVLIDTLKTAFHNLALVIAPIKEAFSNIFPPITAATLVRLTESFKDFVTAMTPTAETIEKIRRIASGFFAALSIGWEIIKEGTAFIRRLAMSLISLVAPETTGFLL
jgi:tape measure domain-containing protein